ncbi:Cna B-type domain-containing protein, partial [Enterococcus ureilyticus]|uniref:Cna B-type domain-containing protein n=1 Tax=Enterococcus ureilyticus TaxID=1131292 RepID=UPI001A920300
HIPEVTEISGTKIWDDKNDQDRKRPTTITVNLLANGAPVDSKEVTEKDNWTYHFANLPKYKDGQEIVYTVTENDVPEYSTSIEGTTITNHYTPGKTSVTVTKSWNDGNNQDGIRPDSIKVQLYADGEKSGEEVTLNEGNNWTTTWTDLAEKNNGQPIVYSVKEVGSIEGYNKTVNAENSGNIIITNTHIPKNGVKGSDPETPSKNSLNKDYPATGEKNSWIFYAIGILLIVIVGYVGLKKVKYHK